ncbi:molecular chaperone DnaK [Bacillus sp. M6-12]|uniref:TraR/DksA C4-type zinc finger protein n=1 Tax=Bacillus sp. M6-12 TaxID=2054166 RepID=UPI000C77EC77|nr:TraR/DksA C4-type zinc finger protein [Bacillus sp. M6-12]PLS14963.1 molecular chaperone DnaK [Bacillus sp. M6-12]
MPTKEEIQTIKKELLSQKEELEMIRKERQFDEKETDSVGELTSLDNHPADLGTELTEREIDLALNNHAESGLAKVHLALEAIEEGTYGICRECGKEIPFERLEIIPTALHCVDHTPERIPPASGRPVEEEGLEPPHLDSFERRRDSDIVDSKDSFAEVARYGTSETPGDYVADLDSYDHIYNKDEDDNHDGYTESIESFIGTDIKGNGRSMYPSERKDEYKQELDDENLEAPFGNVPYKKSDGYVDKK